MKYTTQNRNILYLLLESKLSQEGHHREGQEPATVCNTTEKKIQNQVIWEKGDKKFAEKALS